MSERSKSGVCQWKLWSVFAMCVCVYMFALLSGICELNVQRLFITIPEVFGSIKKNNNNNNNSSTS